MSDDNTSISRQILNVFGSNHPMRIALAFCAATLLKLCAKICFQYYDYPWLKIINEASTWEIWIIFAGIIMVPVVFGKGVAPEGVRTQINTVQALVNAAGLPKARAAIFWSALLDKYIKSLSVDLQQQKPIDIMAEAQKEISDLSK